MPMRNEEIEGQAPQRSAAAQALARLHQQGPGAEGVRALLVWQLQVACLATLAGTAETCCASIDTDPPEPGAAPEGDWLEFVRQSAWRCWRLVLCSQEKERLRAVHEQVRALPQLQALHERRYLMGLPSGWASKEIALELIGLYFLAAACERLCAHLLQEELAGDASESALSRMNLFFERARAALREVPHACELDVLRMLEPAAQFCAAKQSRL